MKKFLLSIFAMFLAFANLQAEEVTVYTLEPAKGSNNSYAGNCDIAIGDITWNLTGNSTMIPWRMGGKSLTGVDRTLYSKNPMVGAVDKVVLSIGTVNSITVNSAKLLVADNADFTNAVETPFTVTANSDSEIAVTASAGSYYKFVFNVTVSDSSNRFIQISKAVFYSSTSGETTAAAAPSLPADCSFTESKTIEITNNEEGATVYYTTDGENFNEYVGEFTINETTTVKAYAQIGDDVATKSFEVTRTYTKLEAKTIAEVIEAGEGEAYTKGTVVATYAKGFLLNDETGYILVYQGNAPTVAAEGDVININGTTSMYGGLLQFAAGANIEKTGTAEVTHPEAVVMDGAAFDAFLTAPEVKYVEYIGTLTINGNYYNVAVEGAETAVASIQYPNEGLVTVESGTVVKVTGYTIGYNKSFVNTMAVSVDAYVEPEPEEPAKGIEAGKQYRIKASNGEYLTIGDSNANPYGHVHGAALDETNNNQMFTFIAVEGQENTYYVQSVAGKYFSYEGTGAGWNVNATDDAAQAHALTFEATEGEFQYLIKCYNALKGTDKYFKYEYVNDSGKSHPYNDADIANAEVWTLEEVAAVEPEPEVTVEIDATKEYFLKSSWNYGMNSGYLALGNKSGANYGHAYMANDNSQAFKFTLVEDGANKYYTLSTEITGTMAYTAYVDCAHASNVNSNAMGGSNLLLELENATSSYYVIKTANGYLKAEMVSYGTDGSAYHVFSNGDRESALVFEIVEKATDTPEVAAPVITAITPAEGAEVESLSEIVLTFDKAIKEVDMMNGIIKVKTTGSTSRAYGYSATISEDGLTVTFPIGDDRGGYKTIEAAGEYTIEIPAGVVTSTDGAKNEAATSTFTIVVPTVEPEPEAFPKVSTEEARYYYKIASYNRGGYLTTVGDGKSVEHIAESMASYWYFTKADDNGGIYFHNYTTEQTLGADKTMSDTPGVWYVLPNGVNEEGLSISSTNPISSSSCIDANNFNSGVGAWNPSADDWEGTTWVFTEVDVDAMVAELMAAREAFEAVYAEAQTIITEANLQATTKAIALQTTDEAAAAYLSSNAPDPVEGSIHHLVDGIVGDSENFFHSNWQNKGSSEDGLAHYLLVDLGTEATINSFQFNYHTRIGAANDYPVDIVIEGSNDGTEFVEVGNVTGIAARSNESYVSPIIPSETAYRYLRFMVTKTTNDRIAEGNDHNYFHLAEFGISAVSVTIAEKYADLVTAVSNLQVTAEAHADNAEYDKDELIAATEAIYAALFDIYKDDNTIALIESAYELLAIEGVGYPAAAPREALQEAIEEAEEMPDTEAGKALQAAIDAYYATTDFVLPEAGKAYTFTAVWGEVEYYIYNNNGTLAVAARGEEELPVEAKFVCEYNADAEYKFQFKTADGKYYLAYPTIGGKSWLDNESVTGLETESSKVTMFNVNKILAGGAVEATNDALFGLIQMDGYRGYNNGKFIDEFGSIVVMHSAQTFDGASAPFYNENYTSAIRIEETVIPVEPLKVVAVTPAEEVTSLREITIEFDAEIAVAELTGSERIYVDYLGINVPLYANATANGKELKIVVDTEIKDAGKHTLVIPADVVTRVSDGVAYEGGTFEFTVVKEDVVVEPLTVVSVKPSEAVESLETIIIEFSDNVSVPATASGKFTIADAEGNAVATLYAWDAAVEGKVVTLTLTEAITTAGEYTFSFAERLVTRQSDGTTCAYSCTITVTGATGIDSINGEAGNATIYDLTGRKVEKITEGGIYIVNGKKVYVK